MAPLVCFRYVTIIPGIIAIVRIAIVDVFGMVWLSRCESVHIARCVDKQKDGGGLRGRRVSDNGADEIYFG